MEALRLCNITFSYGENDKKIFENMDFTLNYGEFVLLSGLSGEGKSTLLSIINGVIPFIVPGKLKGNVYFDDNDVTKLNVSERAPKIGTVLQNADEQIVYDIVRDEIAFGCENLNIPIGEIDKRISDTTAMMKINPNDRTRTMSGGQKQRLITASTLAMRQKILVLDEPLANLDVEGAHVLLSALRRLADNGYAILLVEHRLDVVKPYIDKFMWIEDKTVRFDESPDAFINSEKVLNSGSRNSKNGEPILDCNDISVTFGDKNIIDGLNLSVLRGEKIVLLGHNGCGKTTLLRTIAGLNKLSGGEISQKIVPDKAYKRRSSGWFKKVGLVYQNPTYQLFMPTLLSEVAFRASSEEKARELIDAFGLSGLEDRHPQSLSEGQKRRAGIAAICAGEPELLLLDEPTVGQDFENLKRIVDVINRINCENQCTVITITHDRRCIDALSDRILTMENGKNV